MILRDRGEYSPSDAARELLRDAEVLRRHALHVSSLESRVAAFERRYGIASAEIHRAIDAGTLQESEDVCAWIMDHELLEHVREAAKA